MAAVALEMVVVRGERVRVLSVCMANSFTIGDGSVPKLAIS
jgi:hypothetical protein